MTIGDSSELNRCPECHRLKEKALREQRDRKEPCSIELDCVLRKEILAEIEKTKFRIVK